MQAAYTCLDSVLLVFGTLTKEYSVLKDQDGDNEGVIQTMLDSIKKWWKASDQEIFILAIILNPVLKLTPFAVSVSLSHANI